MSEKKRVVHPIRRGQGAPPKVTGREAPADLAEGLARSVLVGWKLPTAATKAAAKRASAAERARRAS